MAAGGEKLYTSAKQLKVPGYLEIAGVPKTAKERNAAKTDGEEQTQGSDAEAAREEEENAGLLAYAGRLQKGEVLFADGYASASLPAEALVWIDGARHGECRTANEEEELREQIKGSGIGTSATRAEIVKSWFGSAI